MLLIHKETAEIFELLVKSVSDDVYFNISFGLPLGEISLSNPEIDQMPIITYDEIADYFEILGWL